ADGGTLVHDELATVSMGAQERLLRAVEYGEVTRVGSSRPIRVDVRIVAATNEHLPALVEENRFRADLLDRLSFEVITLPPLRAREGDIEVLATYFGQRMAAVLGWDEWPGFGPRALAAMEGHDWPGNVRELRNVIERAIYRWADPSRPVDALSFDPFASPWQPVVRKGAAKTETAAPAVAREAAPAAHVPPSGPVSDLRAAVDAYEKQILPDKRAPGPSHQKVAAGALGPSYDQFRHGLKKQGLNQ
ncbi:MAG: sigma 54-interacting transcriptional regulator, partial [Sphingopyxis sp.]|nr:sigma 54-interacting transcriptional regulator [Sphingopyxis sp.]